MFTGIKRNSKKLSEETKVDPLLKRISKRSFILGAKLNNVENAAHRQSILGALSLLDQAQLLAGKDNKESLRLLNMAIRLGQGT